MAPKHYFFERRFDGKIIRIPASTLAEATRKLPRDYSWDSYWTYELNYTHKDI
jgi:hypothetical protein